MDTIAIGYLADHQELIPDLAAYAYAEWKDLYPPDFGVTQVGEILKKRAVKDRIPITLVAMKGALCVGMASIKLTEESSDPDLSPWVATVYVREDCRKLGVGRALMDALELKAAALGVKTLYLTADNAEQFYLRLGWAVRGRTSDGADAAIMEKTLWGSCQNE